MSDCIFCKIANNEAPANIIYEDDEFVAFYDINPVAKIHVLIIPRKHIETYMDLTEEDSLLMGRLHGFVQQVAERLGVADDGFRLINNCREDGGQVVYHIHYHLLAGEKLPFGKNQAPSN